jgi:hypothetical protein
MLAPPPITPPYDACRRVAMGRLYQARMVRGSRFRTSGQKFETWTCISQMVAGAKFLDSVVRTSRQAKIRLSGEASDGHIGHEPALVARTCGSAELLGFLKFVGAPRRNDARRCDPSAWHG